MTVTRRATVTPTEDPDRFILDGGYVVLVRPDHPCAGPKGTVLEHRIVFYDAGIDPTGYDVHHRNGDKGDNRLENLELVAHDEHTRQHAKSSVEGTLPEPMLARSGRLPTRPGWAFEPKLDGFRAIVRTGERLAVRSRSG